ncbi:uncharacterized protein LOC136082447 isoform X1 [Hydra vulgaris]|uniref:Uncharacterized protein LOC136082447 isoform X1 n=1 Tax=Hydra vulgaris TaxID=6087 RepID=A0ABM4C8B4_HYDVU
MTDYSNEEVNSLETVFPGCQVFICDFHREQAWERWLSKSTNGCSYVKDQVKKKLREIAHSKTEEICKKLVQELEEWPEWKKYPKLAEYLTNTWLSIQKRWVFAYRQDRLLLNVNTNNGIERQHQSFKYSFLEKRKNSSLTAMLSICIEEFLPHKFDKLVTINRGYPTPFWDCIERIWVLNSKCRTFFFTKHCVLFFHKKLFLLNNINNILAAHASLGTLPSKIFS